MKLGLMNRNAARQPRRVMMTSRLNTIRVNIFLGDQCVDYAIFPDTDAGLEDAMRFARVGLRRK